MKGLKPLIKWTGGKSSDIKYMKDLIPEFERYIEPFFGGGALFFNLMPSNAIINDKMTDLMQFYRFIKINNQEFKETLLNLDYFWNEIPKYLAVFELELVDVYYHLRDEHLSEKEFLQLIDNEFENHSEKFHRIFNKSFEFDQIELNEKIRESVKSKLLRLNYRIDRMKKFDYKDVLEHIETAFRNGYYTFFRAIYNRMNIEENKKSEIKIAIFYFIREFCFGGMFRESQSGGFNIPYGGQNYNKKDFSKKVEYVISEEIRTLFKNTQIKNTDFELVIRQSKLTKNDFMFIDPPYDSVFSKYGNNSFSKNDHKRLANVLSKTKSNFIIIIKETPFISELYDDKMKFSISSFDKTYTSNIKSRYNREVKHLIITNSK